MKKYRKLKIVTDFNFPYSDIVKLLDEKSAKIIHKYFNGNQITFPKEFIKKDVMELEIIKEYNDGADILALIQKYNLTEKTLKRKLKRGAKDNEI